MKPVRAVRLFDRMLVLWLLVLPARAMAEPHVTATRSATGRLLIEPAGVPDVPASSIVLNVDNTKWILPDTVTPFESTDQRRAASMLGARRVLRSRGRASFGRRVN